MPATTYSYPNCGCCNSATHQAGCNDSPLLGDTIFATITSSSGPCFGGWVGYSFSLVWNAASTHWENANVSPPGNICASFFVMMSSAAMAGNIRLTFHGPVTTSFAPNSVSCSPYNAQFFISGTCVTGCDGCNTGSSSFVITVTP